MGSKNAIFKVLSLRAPYRWIDRKTPIIVLALNMENGASINSTRKIAWELIVQRKTVGKQ